MPFLFLTQKAVFFLLKFAVHIALPCLLASLSTGKSTEVLILLFNYYFQKIAQNHPALRQTVAINQPG
jgi:hypothetical protein